MTISELIKAKGISKVVNYSGNNFGFIGKPNYNKIEATRYTTRGDTLHVITYQRI